MIIIIVQKIMIIMIAILIIVKWSPQHGYDNHGHPHHENSPSSVRPVMELVSAVRWRHFHLFNVQELRKLPSVTLYCQVTMTVMFRCSHLSEMTTISQLLWDCHLRAFSKCWRCSSNVFVFIFVFVLIVVFLLVMSCFLITLIECLKGHKCLGMEL